MWRANPDVARREVIENAFDPALHFPNVIERVKSLFRDGNNGNKFSLTCLDPVESKLLSGTFESIRRANPHLQVELGFHGTALGNHKNIKKAGFRIPATALQVVNGSAYGYGVYVSKCPVYSTSYVRDEPKMFVVAVLTGDKKVSRHGNILVAHDATRVLPIYVMHYQGHTPSPSYQNRVVNNPIFQYLSWYLIASLIIVGVSLAAYILTGTLLTITWSIGWGHLSGMGFFEYVFSGGTSSVLFYVSFLHNFAYTITRGVFYCVIWKFIRLLFSFILPVFQFMYAISISFAVLRSIIRVFMFLFRLIGFGFLNLFTSIKFYVIAGLLIVGIFIFIQNARSSRLRKYS